MRKKIVAGNWKMNLDYNEGLSLFSEIVNLVKDELTGSQQAVVCSPFIHLHGLAKMSEGYCSHRRAKRTPGRIRRLYRRNIRQNDKIHRR